MFPRGDVHFVDMNFDPLWGPSILWIVKYLNLMGSIIFVDLVKQLTLCGVRPLCGLNIDPSWDPSTLWT